MTKPGEKGCRKRGSLRRILRILISASLLFSVLAVSGAGLLCNWIFARQDHSQDLVRSYSADLARAYPRRAVSFASGKNTLQGYLYTGQSPQGVILMAHGMGGSSQSHLTETLYFVDRGFLVLAFDGTGVGESTGSSRVGLQQMTRDLLAALEYLQTEPQTADLPVVLYGHSMGGYAVAIAARECPAVAAVVSISGFESPMETMRSTGVEMAGSTAEVGYPFLYLYNRLVFGALTDVSAAEAINQTQVPFLIVHGTEDPLIGESASILGQRERITNPQVRYLRLEGGHGAPWLTAEGENYQAAAEASLEELQREYAGALPETVFRDFYSSLDQQMLFQLDMSFMDTVAEFCLSAVED